MQFRTLAGLTLAEATAMYGKCPRVAKQLNQYSVFATITEAVRCAELPASLCEEALGKAS